MLIARACVQMSRARLGLYVFCRQSLFAGCYELAPTFSQLASRPSQLMLVPNEVFPATRGLTESADGFAVESLNQLSLIVQQMAITALQGTASAAAVAVVTQATATVPELPQTSSTEVADVPTVDESAPTPPPVDSDDVITQEPVALNTVAFEPVSLPPTAPCVM